MQLPLFFAAVCALPRLPKATSSESCGSVLLQSRRALDKMDAPEDDYQTLTDVSVPQAAGWLGWGRWVARGDFWHMQNLGGESLFGSHMPASCFREVGCRHAHSFKSQHFSSVETWSNYYGSSLGLKISGGFNGFSGSIDASTGSTASSSGDVSKRISYATTMSQRACYTLIRDEHCAYNKSNLQPAFLERLAALPQGDDLTPQNLEAWKASFIQRFGTHLVTSSSHGAMVQSLVAVDTRSEEGSSCMDSGLCLKFGWMSSVGVELCGKTSSCDNSSRSSESEKFTCVALGGDSSLQSKICQADVSRQTVDAWLEGGDLQAGSSAYRFSFMPISEFLTNVDFDEYYEAAQALSKATAYSNCRIGENPPVQVWDGSACRCVRACSNGGTLDPSTCTCKCRGNAKHGWQGPDCKESYGRCQRGSGSSGTPTARKRNCNNNNWCGGIERSATCSNAQVCCNRDEGGICCPHGSTCDCWGSGRFCRCLPP